MNLTPDDFEVKRLQLMAGLISVPDVIDWADNIILESDIPDNAIINLALSQKSPLVDVIAQLQQLACGCDRYRTIRIVLGLMYQALLKDRSLAREFSCFLLQEAITNRHTFPSDFLFIYRIDDDYSRTDEGYGSIEAITDEFIEILKEFNET